MFFRDMADETLDEIHSRDGFFHIFFIFVTVVVESNHTAVIFINSRGSNDWASKITSDIFEHCFWITQIEFGISIKSLFVVVVTLYLRTYEQHIKPHFKGRKIKDIKAENLQHLLNLESKKLSKRTLSWLKVILNRVFNQAYKNEIIKKNPVPLAQFPKYPSEKERRVMTKEEQNIFLKYVRKLYYSDIFEVALSTGMRNGELWGLEWKDVDFEEKVIHVRRTLVYSATKGYYKTSPKTRTSKRDIPMLDNVYTILKTRKERQSELKKFLEDKWKPYSGLENLVFCKDNGIIFSCTSGYKV